MKYKHKHTGQIVTKGTDGLFHSQQDGYTLQRWIFENSNDWEEVKEEPNYLITAFRFKDWGDVWKLGSNGKYGVDIEKGNYDLDEMLKGYISVSDNSVQIYSAKTSHGIEFTLNDTAFYQSEGKRGENFKIHNFFINRDGILLARSSEESSAICEDINTIVKCKQVLYTTTDGVDVYNGDKIYFYLLPKGEIVGKLKDCFFISNFSQQDKEVADRYLTFTSEENRDKYIKENTKKSIFISADEVEIFEGDKYYVPQKTFTNELTGTYLEFTTEKYISDCGTVRYSSKESAQEFIDNNKPKYSLKEIESCYPSPTNSPLFTTFIANLKKLGK